VLGRKRSSNNVYEFLEQEERHTSVCEFLEGKEGEKRVRVFGGENSLCEKIPSKFLSMGWRLYP
jgi:hypothetical protein